jgi:hypothetical protein
MITTPFALCGLSSSDHGNARLEAYFSPDPKPRVFTQAGLIAVLRRGVLSEFGVHYDKQTNAILMAYRVQGPLAFSKGRCKQRMGIPES